jgi:hypothetical protein
MRKFHLWIIFAVGNTTRRFARCDLTLVAGAQMAARGACAKWAIGVCRPGHVLPPDTLRPRSKMHVLVLCRAAGARRNRVICLG